mmetsp:Transcript_10222/g.28555  ORF Transcript_10222/g.28555 Transcript_10222/m.28555 type:complete len:908 (-) Transcript_10222:94-2817(-)
MALAALRRRTSQKTAPPEDAPAGHIAYKKIRCWKGRTVYFDYDVGTSNVKRLELTIRSCGNLRAEAERICRLCYLRFEEGRSKDEVVEYRNQLLERQGYQVPSRKRKAAQSPEPAAEVPTPAKSDDCAAAAAAWEAAPEAAAAAWGASPVPSRVPVPALSTPVTAKPRRPAGAAPASAAPEVRTAAPARAQAEEAQAEEAPAAAPEHDAPEGHPAHTEVKTEDQEASFEYAPSGGATVTFRTNAQACGNSLAEAERISRLCYMRFQEGMSEQEVLYYRNCLLSGCSFLLAPRRRLCRKASADSPTTASAAPVKQLAAPATSSSPAAARAAEASAAVHPTTAAAPAGAEDREEPARTAKRPPGRPRKRQLFGGPRAASSAAAAPEGAGVAADAGQPEGEAAVRGAAAADAAAGGGSSAPPLETRAASMRLIGSARKRPGLGKKPETPEDAPEGHAAHVKVRAKNGVVSFKFESAEGEVHFQTTMRACGSSLADAERICRLCFVKFEEGLTKEEVLRYRNRLYEQCGYKVPTRPKNAKRCAAKQAQAAAGAEDAPEGHPAHRRCKTHTDGKVVSFDHMFSPGGPYTCFQTTTLKCNGSLKEAQRICRLCFMKFEAGWSKDEVLRFREHEYRKCGLRRLCRGSGMFYRLGTFHRSPGAAAAGGGAGAGGSGAASGQDGGGPAAATTPDGTPDRSAPAAADDCTPAKDAPRAKRCAGSEPQPAAAEKRRASAASGGAGAGDAAEADAAATPISDTDARTGEAAAAAGAATVGRLAVALPWPALHGQEATAEAERPERHDGIKGLAHQLRRMDASAQTALHRRFCSRRRLPGPRRSAAAGGASGAGGSASEFEGSVRDVLLELEHGIAPISGLVINHLLLACDESLASADVLATRAPDVSEIWRELAVDEPR